MTIFHTIKYPLSHPILADELDTIRKELPDLYNKWFYAVYSNYNDVRNTKDQIEDLHKMLAEWSGPL